MYPALLHAHSGMRWILLALLLINILNAANSFGRKPISPQARKLSLIGLIVTHLQLLIGLGLYAISPKVQFSSATMSNDMLRFFTMEHNVMMLIAIILITLGHRKAKAGNGKSMFWHYFIALVFILAAIPWPFRAALGGSWF